MFFVRGNENRIIYGLKYSHYLVKYDFPRKLMMFFRRIAFDGFSFGIPLGFSVNFRLISLSEYHNKYCHHLMSVCPNAKNYEGKGLSFAMEKTEIL